MEENIKIWHTTEEQPDICELILIERTDGSVLTSYLYSKPNMANWKRWIYVKDILELK